MAQAPLKEPPNRPVGGRLPDFEQHRKSSKKTNYKFLAVGLVIVIAAVTIVVVAMQGSSVYYITLAEFNNKQATFIQADKEVRVAGKVLTGSIDKDSVPGAVVFTAYDTVNKSQTMKVEYDKIPPDTFRDDADVVVTGTYTNGVFKANEMLAKCPSKYSSQAQS
jgi:cytochrome c-type biogenesis protein CcmE